jgi:hypothetical protein
MDPLPVRNTTAQIPSDIKLPMIPTLPNGEPQKGQSSATPASAPGQGSTHTAQESFGPAAGSGLIKASIQAGIGFAIVLAGLTFGPYFWEKSHAATNAVPAPAEKGDTQTASQPTNPPAAAPTPSTPTDPNANSKAPSGNPTAGKQPNGKGTDILDKLGENGTKTAPTKVNPLDKKDDDLLKDIK